MPTSFRGYPDIPVNVEPDVPHWLSLALQAVDKDVQAVEDRSTSADRENLIQLRKEDKEILASATTAATAAAKTYTDAADTASRSAWAAADVTARTAAVAAAKTYTDSTDEASRSAWAAADVTARTAAVAAAKTYADSADVTARTAAVAAAKTYTDSTDEASRSAWASADVTARTAAVAAAKTYTDTETEKDRVRVSRIETTAVFDGDARLMETMDVDGLLLAMVDGEDGRTWLESDLQGLPTPEAAEAIGSALGFTDVALDSAEVFVLVDQEDSIIYSVEPPTASATPGIPSDDWTHLGDSMTDDAVTGAESWVAKLSKLTGRKHYNGGWYGQTSAQIAARQGSLPPLVTVKDNVTAATGATPVTGILNTPVSTSKTRSVKGTLAGIPGTLAQPYAELSTFTPDLAGAYPVPPRSRFTPRDSAITRGRIHTIWSGRNDVWTTDPALVVAHVQTMIDYLDPGVRRVLVFEIPPSTTDGGGKALAEAINAALKAAFPAYWVPICSWLRTDDAAAAAGVEFTETDRADIAKGHTPAVFRLDNVHINAAGCTAVAYRTHQEAQKRGWL